jgi:hypothetical protein
MHSAAITLHATLSHGQDPLDTAAPGNKTMPIVQSLSPINVLKKSIKMW